MENQWFIAAVVFGLIIDIICLLSYAFNNRKITLLFRMTFDIVSIFYGICVYFASGVGAIWAVVLTDFIGISRDIVYLCRAKYKWADKVVWLILFEILFAASIAFNFKELPISILPIIGSLINNVGLYLKDVKKTKGIILVGQSFFIIYYVLLLEASDLLTILGLISSSTFFLSALIGLILIKIREGKEKSDTQNC